MHYYDKPCLLVMRNSIYETERAGKTAYNLKKIKNLEK